MNVQVQKMANANGNGAANGSADADEGRKVMSECVMNGVRKKFAVNGYYRKR
jgi:hypothetical protein